MIERRYSKLLELGVRRGQATKGKGKGNRKFDQSNSRKGEKQKMRGNIINKIVEMIRITVVIINTKSPLYI